MEREILQRLDKLEESFEIVRNEILDALRLIHTNTEIFRDDILPDSTRSLTARIVQAMLAEIVSSSKCEFLAMNR